MPQKVKTFIAANWFAIFTIIGMGIHAWYMQVYAVDITKRDIRSLKSDIELLKPLPAIVATHTNELAELKRFMFQQERERMKFQRNIDRLVWVVDELARKNGIVPPKHISEQNYE